MLLLCIAWVVDSADAQVRARRGGPARRGKQSGESLQERYRIILPPRFDEHNPLTPVVYALHGYKNNMAAMEEIWKDVCAELGIVLVVLQGSKIVDGGYAWASSEDAGEVIDAARKELRSKYRLSLHAPRVLTGFSQGAFEMYNLADSYPKTWRRLIPAAGMFRAKTTLMAQPFTDAEEKIMKRWRIYMMVGMEDAQELVANQNKLATDLEKMGAAVLAPFRDMNDASWGIYQETKHSLPTDKAERDSELRRSLRFVLLPDAEDEKHWLKADPQWRKRAAWLEKAEPKKKKRMESGGKSKKKKRPKPTKDENL